MVVKKKILFFILFFLSINVFAQEKKNSSVLVMDSLTLKKHIHKPSTATKLSLFFPGLGQAYNKDYWKIPLAIGIVAVPTYIYFYNNDILKKLQYALEINNNVYGNAADSLKAFNSIDPILNQIKNSPSALARNRTVFRQNREQALLWILIMWGINVAEATVSGHLKNFNVSSDISMDINPNIQMNQFGLGLVFRYNPTKKMKQFTK